MKRFLLAAVLSLGALPGVTTAVRADPPCSYGLGCFGSVALQWYGRSFMHGPLYNYGPYYGYPPFEPYGPWNQYLQYGPSSPGYGYAVPGAASGYGSPVRPMMPGIGGNARAIQPPIAMPTAGSGAGYAGTYNPYYPAPRPGPYVPQSTPVVPAQYDRPATR